MGLFLLVGIVVGIALSVQLFVIGLEHQESSSLQFVYTALVMVIVLTLPLLAMLFILVSANELAKAHRQLLARLSLSHALRLGHWEALKRAGEAVKTSGAAEDEHAHDVSHAHAHADAHGQVESEVESESLRGAIEAMSAAQDKLEVDEAATPFTVLGLPASFGLVSSLLSIVALIVGAIGTMMWEAIIEHYQTFFKGEAHWIANANATFNNTNCSGVYWWGHSP